MSQGIYFFNKDCSNQNQWFLFYQIYRWEYFLVSNLNGLFLNLLNTLQHSKFIWNNIWLYSHPIWDYFKQKKIGLLFQRIPWSNKFNLCFLKFHIVGLWNCVSLFLKCVILFLLIINHYCLLFYSFLLL